MRVGRSNLVSVLSQAYSAELYALFSKISYIVEIVEIMFLKTHLINLKLLK